MVRAYGRAGRLINNQKRRFSARALDDDGFVVYPEFLFGFMQALDPLANGSMRGLTTVCVPTVHRYAVGLRLFADWHTKRRRRLTLLHIQ